MNIWVPKFLDVSINCGEKFVFKKCFFKQIKSDERIKSFNLAKYFLFDHL